MCQKGTYRMTIDEFFEMQARSLARWGDSPETIERITEMRRKLWADETPEKRAAFGAALNITASSTVEAVRAYMGLFASDARAEELAAWGENVCDDSAKFWAVVTEIWSACDRIPHERFERLFEEHGVDDYIARRKLPKKIGETVTVYRGQDMRGEVGLSWSLSRQVAEGFARGHRGILNPNPMVVRRRVRRDDIVLYTNARNEQEIVLRDWLCGSKSARFYVDGKDATAELTARWLAEMQAEAAE